MRNEHQNGCSNWTDDDERADLRAPHGSPLQTQPCFRVEISDGFVKPLIIVITYKPNYTISIIYNFNQWFFSKCEGAPRSEHQPCEKACCG